MNFRARQGPAQRFPSAALSRNPTEKSDVIYVNNNTNASDGVSTRFLYDATNIKLKNVTLSYTLPSGLKPVSDVLKGARIFVSADNLFTWFKDDWKGYSDIDIFGIGGYNTLMVIPVPTTLTMGFNLTF